MNIELNINKLTKKRLNTILSLINKKLCFICNSNENMLKKITISDEKRTYELKNARLGSKHNIQGVKLDKLLEIEEKNVFYHLIVDEIVNIIIGEEFILFALESLDRVIIKQDGDSWLLNDDEKKIIDTLR